MFENILAKKFLNHCFLSLHEHFGICPINKTMSDLCHVKNHPKLNWVDGYNGLSMHFLIMKCHMATSGHHVPFLSMSFNSPSDD